MRKDAEMSRRVVNSDEYFTFGTEQSKITVYFVALRRRNGRKKRQSLS